MGADALNLLMGMGGQDPLGVLGALGAGFESPFLSSLSGMLGGGDAGAGGAGGAPSPLAFLFQGFSGRGSGASPLSGLLGLGGLLPGGAPTVGAAAGVAAPAASQRTSALLGQLQQTLDSLDSHLSLNFPHASGLLAGGRCTACCLGQGERALGDGLFVIGRRGLGRQWHDRPRSCVCIIVLVGCTQSCCVNGAEAGFNISELLNSDHQLLGQLHQAGLAWEAEHCSVDGYIPGVDVPTSCTVRAGYRGRGLAWLHM